MVTRANKHNVLPQDCCGGAGWGRPNRFTFKGFFLSAITGVALLFAIGLAAGYAFSQPRNLKIERNASVSGHISSSAAFMLPAPGAHTYFDASDIIFRDGFENTAPPPSAKLSFVNQTVQRVNRKITGTMSYLFDALWVDFNSDGCYGAFVFNHGDPAQSRLWVNRCDGSHMLEYFSEEAVNYFIPEPLSAGAAGWLTLLDANGDGAQDFWSWYAGQQAAWYVNGTPAGAHVPWFSEKRLACNDHCVFSDINGDHRLDIIHPDRGVEDILTRMPVAPPTGQESLVVVADVDGDGWSDILQPELGGYWHNQQGQLQWVEAGLSGSPSQNAVADFDNDGDMDLFLFTGGPARLFQNDGAGQFTDVTSGSGLGNLENIPWWTGYSNSVSADFNNDGLQDLAIAGAKRVPSVTLFRNLGGMRFVVASVDLGPAGHGSQAFKSRVAVADFDNDGRLDIIKTQDETSVGIWRNTTPTGGADWMKVRVRGVGLNTDGVGTDVKWYRHGTSILVAHMVVRVGEQHPQTWLHTGLGNAARVDMVVTYPVGGPQYRFENLQSNQEVIVYPNGCLVQHWQPGYGWPLTAPMGCGS